MSTPRQMVDHMLDVVKGWIPGNMAALDKSAKLSTNVTFRLPAGRVVHLNNAGDFETGCANTQMAIFVWQNSDDPDVNNPGTGVWQPVFPAGMMSGLVATGGYELATTEFDKTLTYAYNQLLRAPVNNTNPNVGGVLTNAGVTLYTTAVCGVVSRPPHTNAHGKSVLTFWPVYLPGTT